MRMVLLTLHISGGILAMLSGAVAMAFRKGFRWHALAGKVFVGAMLTMAGAGATLAVMKNEMTNILGGTLTVYLVATAWMTARRGEREKAGVFDWAALSLAMTAGLAEMGLGMLVAMGKVAKTPGVPLAMYFIFATIMLLAASGDVRWIMQGGAYGLKRIVRHLWRMTFAFFIATGSFFLGQQKVFPKAWRGAAIWWVLGLFPLMLMIGWLVRVWATGRWRAAPSGGPVRKSIAAVDSAAVALR